MTIAQITCPKCDQISESEIPVDACLFFYKCPHCHQMMRPNSGDCCVFCSFGSEKCPSSNK